MIYFSKNREHLIDESFNKEKALRCLRQAFKCNAESSRNSLISEDNTPVSLLKKLVNQDASKNKAEKSKIDLSFYEFPISTKQTK